MPLIHLGSGLTAEGRSSYMRQLTILKSGLETCGYEAALAGPLDKPDISCAGAVLLGYPEQFPWLSGDLPCPVYLWAQYSKPCRQASPVSWTWVPLTGQTAAYLAEGGNSRPGPVIPHGVDTSLFRPSAAQYSRTAGDTFFTLGTVAAHTARKQFRRIFESFALFAKDKTGVKLLIKTDVIRSRDGEDLDAMADAFNLRGKTEIITADLSDGELMHLYNRMDTYINLSEWEGFCIPVIEAMACGIPVIAQAGQGPGELISPPHLKLQNSRAVMDGETRLLHADPAEAAAFITRAWKHSGEMKELTRAGLPAFRARFSIDTVTRQWISLIEKGCLTPGKSGT
ncbi:MAG: glycosyltransferase family 1 protein [Spirochaetales bacterium]|nr:MAG: glycosyltransferase family 1 protein [Spirochaetales bacterium]